MRTHFAARIKNDYQLLRSCSAIARNATKAAKVDYGFT